MGGQAYHECLWKIGLDIEYSAQLEQDIHQWGVLCRGTVFDKAHVAECRRYASNFETVLLAS